MSYRDGNAEIYAMNFDGSNQIRLTNNTYEDTQPAWSPNGSRIVFRSTRNGDTDIYVMNADGTGQTSLFSDIPTGYPTYNPDDNAGEPAWSPDGQKIAYVSNRCVTISTVGGFYEDCNYREVRLMSPDGVFLEQLTGSDTRESCQKSDPAWSPDGRRLAWASNCQGFNSNYFGTDIWVASLDGSAGATRLTGPGGNAFDPAWSPDGQRIAYKGYTSTGFGLVNDIYVMNANGSGKTALTNTPAIDDLPDWQPVDNTPPDTAITSGPSGPSASSSASFSFSSTESGSVFQCSLDNAAFTDCNPSPNTTTTKSYTGLADGSHTFQVRANDGAGNVDLTPASRTWTVDTTEPTIALAAPPDGATYDLNQAVNADYSCADGAAGSGLASCQGTVDSGSPIDTASSGARTFTVTATDNAGNQRSVTHAYTVSEYTQTGTSGSDTIVGTAGDDVIFGGGGNDTIRGGGGNDTLIGGDGNDKLLGGEGNDTLDGQAGGDTVSFTESVAAVNAFLVLGAASGEGSDTLANVEHIEGSNLADTLEGSGIANRISSLGGTDTIRGFGAGDRLTGGSSRDLLYGGPGKDSILGGTGADSHFGENGDDTLDSRDGVSGNDDLDGGPDLDTCLTDPTEKSVLRCEL